MVPYISPGSLEIFQNHSKEEKKRRLRTNRSGSDARLPEAVDGILVHVHTAALTRAILVHPPVVPLPPPPARTAVLEVHPEKLGHRLERLVRLGRLLRHLPAGHVENGVQHGVPQRLGRRVVLVGVVAPEPKVLPRGEAPGVRQPRVRPAGEEVLDRLGVLTLATSSCLDERR